MPIGVLINGLAVFGGGIIGALLRHKLPQRIKSSLSNIFGLAGITIGISLITKINSLAAVVLALLLGTLVGEILYFEDSISKVLYRFKKYFHKNESGEDQSEMMLSVIVLFCTSATGVFGAMHAGMTGDESILLVKSILDFFTAIIFGASLGYLVAMVALPQIIIGCILFYGATFILPLTNDLMIADFKACGGIITLAAGLRVCEIKSIRVLNMLPALLVVMPLSYLWMLIF